MNKKFWMAGFLVIPKVYAVIASPFSTKTVAYNFVVFKSDWKISDFRSVIGNFSKKVKKK